MPLVGCPAGDVGHPHAAESVVVDVVVLQQVQQVFQGDGAFGAGQGGAQAAVDAVAEAEVLGSGAVAVDVESVGIGKGAFVAVGGGFDEQHRFGSRDGDVVQANGFVGVAHRVLSGCLDAQHLFHGRRDHRAVGLKLTPLVGVPPQLHHRVADQLGDRFGACAGEQGSTSVRAVMVTMKT